MAEYNRSMRSKLRRAWPIVKSLLWLLLLYVIGRQFARDLQRPELSQRPLHGGWLLLSGLLYVGGQGLSALYWRRLLGHLGVHPPLGAALRAYYIGQLGKYLPGKAWALFLRTSLVHSHGVSVGLAVLTAFYEVLTTMAAGVLVAAVLFAALGTGGGTIGAIEVVLLSLLLLGAFLVPLHPALFNRLALRLTGGTPFPPDQLPHTPPAQLRPIRFVYLLEGLAFTAAGWLLLGASFAAALRGIVGADWPLFDVRTARLPAIMGLSYVIGFVVVIAPGGLGVREVMLTLLLTPELLDVPGRGSEGARATVVLIVLVLRLVWTAAELITALVCWVTGRATANFLIRRLLQYLRALC